MKQTQKIRQLNKVLQKVRSYQERMRNLTDEELSHLTVEFKARLTEGETLDDILPEAFAAVCEADYRILGMFPFDAQVIGGIALHQGYLAEMNTGEGKTLVATMPLYLNALSGRSTILMTTNDYLALRDAKEMGQVYRFMGLSIAAGVQERGDKPFTNAEKKKIYDSDIVYTTHGIFGFDYLLNNLVISASDRFLRELYYVIIDEADSVLLDAAQTPLVISGSPRVQSNLYELADFFVTTLREGIDYGVEEKKVWLTEEGIRNAEMFFQIDNFYGENHFEINRHVTLALRAHALFELEKDYMVSNEGEMMLLDGGSGRLMPGVKLRGGQHQALEIKEHLKLSQENRSVASITYQNLFLLFEKMSGMSGTISDAAEELLNVYGEKVLVIPPNRPVLRVDYKDVYFANKEDQIVAALEEVISVHETGQPVLVVVSTIKETELMSKLLMGEGVPHSVLNANNAFWEAEIVKEAGQMNAVTVATSMAGRGTDIKLGESVKELGGLAVIGIGRMNNIRQERQARGRAGRQGDPGYSRFYVSLEDEVVRFNGPKNLDKYIEEGKKISKGRLRRLIKHSQSLGEEFAVSSRKQAMDYDKVMQKQRALIYQTRDRLLDGGTLEQERLLSIIQHNIRVFLKENKDLDLNGLNRYILDHISYRLDAERKEIPLKKTNQVEFYLMQLVEKNLEERQRYLGSQIRMDDFKRAATLSAIDDAWVEQVDYLQQLQSAVAGRTIAQRNPVYEYQADSLEAFQKMEAAILKNTMRNILLSNVYVDEEQKLHIIFP